MPVLLERVFATLALWIERAGERRNLSDLDDHLLRDIGLPLYDARREAKRPFWKGTDCRYRATGAYIPRSRVVAQK